ncbi:hypothetical protein [Pseudoxanthomonas sacheonensis]|uniref:hypothetical protein n=1 Tax=Pseudoxanthomonas sacheonensis TaxID=443615 RepID=UPI0013D38B8A|nr:hypothetical protein [Pseudoxanthomonas sacheonensis]KAF1706243.1 hypothetical protein CSC73_16180 [Pseudoxanthomonas sacheonensis]
MRTVDGYTVAFVDSESYFQGFHTPSMVSTSRETGADIVLLLAPGKSGDDVPDDEIRKVISAAELTAKPGAEGVK